MAVNETDDLEKLLQDVRKTISENRQFLERLADEADESQEEPDTDDGALHSNSDDGECEEL